MNMPPAVIEVSGELKRAGTVVLDSTGAGVIIFHPDNAWQRWEIDGVYVSTNQDSTATVVPVAAVAKNSVDVTQASPGNIQSATWSGNQDTFAGTMKIGPADFLSVLFYGPAGQDATTLIGVMARAVVTGTYYTRRG